MICNFPMQITEDIIYLYAAKYARPGQESCGKAAVAVAAAVAAVAAPSSRSGRLHRQWPINFAETILVHFAKDLDIMTAYCCRATKGI